MSYTLKKLKQSEIDHGYQKPTDKINTKPSYGIFIACFVITLSIFLVLLDQGKETPSEVKVSLSKKTDNSLNKTPVSNTSQKQLVDEIAVKKAENNEKITLLPKENELITGIKETTITTPAEYIEPISISQVEKKLPGKNPLNLENMPEDQDILAANTDLQISEKSKDNRFDSGELETFQIENKFDNNDNAIQNDQPVLWQNLSFSFRNSMPEMKLNGIIYLKNENDRYVFINMTKYKINDVVLEIGPSIVEIKQHSVIMLYEDRQFIFSVNQ